MSHPEDEDDGALFRSAIGEVTPLRKVEVPAITRPRPRPRARMAEQD
ncbi:MAG: SMR domain protein, partial [Stenotrophomonas acidaminiphila]|nr:SMR domain protein [Stenotrophomonas acidaminiphila]